VLVIQRLCKTFEGALDGKPVPALESIDLEIAQNEFVSLIGPSGCGKSPLLNCVAGLAPGYSTALV